MKKDFVRILIMTAIGFLLTTSPVLAKQGDYLKVGSDNSIKRYSMPEEKQELLQDFRRMQVGDKFYKEVQNNKYLDPVQERKNQMSKLREFFRVKNIKDFASAREYLKSNRSEVKEALSKGTQETKHYTESELSPGNQEELIIEDIF